MQELVLYSKIPFLLLSTYKCSRGATGFSSCWSWVPCCHPWRHTSPLSPDRLTFTNCLVQIHNAENHTQSIPVNRLAQPFSVSLDAHLLENCLIFYYGTIFNSSLWHKAAVPDECQSAGAGWCSRISPNESVTEMQLKASYLGSSVGSSVVSPPSACLRWVQLSTRLGLEMTSQPLTSEGFVFVTENLVSLSLALGLFLFPQHSAEISKTELKTTDFQINGPHISQNWTICSLHVDANQQIFSLACHRDWKQAVYFI